MVYKKVWHLRKQILPHLLFLISCTVFLTVLFIIGLPSLIIGLSLVLKWLELIYSGSYTFNIYVEEKMHVAFMEINLKKQSFPKLTKTEPNHHK